MNIKLNNDTELSFKQNEEKLELKHIDSSSKEVLKSKLVDEQALTEFLLNQLSGEEPSESFEEFKEEVESLLYKYENPISDTNCGSIRIVNTVTDIVLCAIKYAVNEIGLNKNEKRFFCNKDLLKESLETVKLKLEEMKDIEKIEEIEDYLSK